MIELELNVFWHTSESAQLEECSIEVDLERDCEQLKHTFYHIDYVRPCENPKHCTVVVGGDELCVNHTYAYVKKKIKEQLIGFRLLN